MYIYNADSWCDSCGREICKNLDGLEIALADDSDHYPQSALSEATDSPDHCAGSSKCLEAIDLREYGLASDARLYGAEDFKIGALLSDGLTDEGISYLREMLDNDDPTEYQRALYRFWRAVFADELS